MADLYKGIAGSPITYLAADISANQTTISIADDSALPDAPNICTIGYGENIETIRYGAKSNGVLQNVTRGLEGTPRAWKAGTEVARFYTAYEHNAIVETIESHLAEYVKSLGSNGYQKLPGGLIIQWGVANVGARPESSSNGIIYKNMTVTFPVTFPNAVFSIATSTYRAASSGHQNLTKSSVILSLTKLSNVWESAEVYYVAVGY